MADSEPKPVAAHDALWEAECARRTLLSHLGITPLVSRFDPVAAKPAQRLHVPTGFNDVTSIDDPATSNSDDEMRAAQLRDVAWRCNEGASAEEADAIPRRPLKKLAMKPPTAVSRLPIMARCDVRYALSLLFVTSDDVLWVEVLEDQLLRQEQLQLIAAMARAIRGARYAVPISSLIGPQPQAAIAAVGGMGDMLSGFLHRVTSDHATRHILQLGTCEVLPDMDLPIHRVPSSLEMLRDGSLKQSAWSILKPLRAGD